MGNYWLDKTYEITESEILLVRNTLESRKWYDLMDETLPVITPERHPKRPLDFTPQIGIAHHLKFTRFGIEAVLKIPRKYQRFPTKYLLYDKFSQPRFPFWVVILDAPPK